MTADTTSADAGHAAVGDRVRLPLTFDPARMTEEVRGLALPDFVEYSVIPLTAPTPRSSGPVEDYADGSWAEWRDTPMFESCTYLSSVANTFREHTTVTLARLLRLAPGGIIEEHTDPTLGLEQERSVIRLTVPITAGDGVQFYLNDTLVPMQPGECWYLRLTDPHRVVNAGTEERINMSLDVIPNRWVRSLIAGA